VWKDLLKQYIAPAGIGATVAIVGALAVTLPKLLDYSDEIRRQESLLRKAEADYSAYSKVMQRYYRLLNDEKLRSLFPSDAISIARPDMAALGNDEWTSIALKRSREGAYFVWCERGSDSSQGPAVAGEWLTRAEAQSWAVEYLSASAFLAAFPKDDPKTVNRISKPRRCSNWRTK
jgi:hypothetical protein